SAPGNGKSFASLSRTGAAPAAAGVAAATTTAARAAAKSGGSDRFMLRGNTPSRGELRGLHAGAGARALGDRVEQRARCERVAGDHERELGPLCRQLVTEPDDRAAVPGHDDE